MGQRRRSQRPADEQGQWTALYRRWTEQSRDQASAYPWWRERRLAHQNSPFPTSEEFFARYASHLRGLGHDLDAEWLSSAHRCLWLASRPKKQYRPYLDCPSCGRTLDRLVPQEFFVVPKHDFLPRRDSVRAEVRRRRLVAEDDLRSGPQDWLAGWSPVGATSSGIVFEAAQLGAELLEPADFALTPLAPYMIVFWCSCGRRFPYRGRDLTEDFMAGHNDQQKRLLARVALPCP